jgi:hypothetical protein
MTVYHVVILQVCEENFGLLFVVFFHDVLSLVCHVGMKLARNIRIVLFEWEISVFDGVTHTVQIRPHDLIQIAQTIIVELSNDRGIINVGDVGIVTGYNPVSNVSASKPDPLVFRITYSRIAVPIHDGFDQCITSIGQSAHREHFCEQTTHNLRGQEPTHRFGRRFFPS